MADQIQEATETPTEDVSLDGAIEAAQTELSKDSEPAQSDSAGSEQPESPEKEPADPVSAEDSGESQTKSDLDAETQRAVDFYKVLQDPDRGPAFLEFLANQAGIKTQKAETDKSEQKVPDLSITDVVRQELGEEFAFMADKLGPAMEKVLARVVGPLQQQVLQSRVETEVDRAINTLQTKHSDFKQLEPQIGNLLKSMQPGPGVSQQEHLENLYFIAKARQPQSAPTKLSRDAARNLVEKINKNAKETMPSPSAAHELKVVKGPALPTLEQALDAALRGEVFE